MKNGKQHPVKGNEKQKAAESPVKENEKWKVEPPIKENRKGEIPSRHPSQS